MHCLDGRRVVGLVVFCLRRLQGWAPVPSLMEFWRFQTSIRPVIAPAEIEKVSRELEKLIAEFGEVVIPEFIPT
jgi:protein tyrosine/serine phosphatase